MADGATGLRAAGSGDWIDVAPQRDGVELMRARFAGLAFARHRHDTYTLCVTDEGLQGFNYRGAARLSAPGQVTVLHPDEPHDGHAAADGVFAYRSVYVGPDRISAAARSLCGRSVPLPFLGNPVTRNERLAGTIRGAFQEFPRALEPLALTGLISALAEALLDADQSVRQRRETALDLPALQRGRDFLNAEAINVVGADALEEVSGLDRYAFARQFRRQYGTSPYRYLLLRRLDRVRAALDGDGGLASIAAATGFADQAHMTRLFKAAYGLTPAQYRRVRRSAPGRDASGRR